MQNPRPTGNTPGRGSRTQNSYGQSSHYRSASQAPSRQNSSAANGQTAGRQAQNERISAIRPTPSARPRVIASQPAPAKKPAPRRNSTALRDFLLSFFVALVIFGIAAIFVCSALIGMFT